MPLIKPISDLRNKANEISDLAHKSDEPIFITRNGLGDMVVMSIAQYSKLQLKIDLFGQMKRARYASYRHSPDVRTMRLIAIVFVSSSIYILLLK